MFISFVLARLTNPAIGNLGNLSTSEFIQGFLRGLITFGFVVGGIAFLFMLILGGIQWITSGGDKIQAESARRRITNALVGIVVLFSLFAILNFVGCFFGIDFRTINFGPFQVSFGTCQRDSGEGNGGGNGGNGAPNGGVSVCPCGGACQGYYAILGARGRRTIGSSTNCYQCTASGWSQVSGSCGVLTCRDPNWECRNL